MDLGSNGPQQSSILVGEDSRSLLNTNSKENSEVTVETIRMISEEISNQTSRKLNEIKESLNYQIQDAISSAITDQILPSIQNTLNKHGKVGYTVMDQRSSGPHEGPSTENYTKVDHMSGGPQWNLENENNHVTRDKRNKMWSLRGNDGQMSRQSSVDSITSEQNRDMVTGAKLTPHVVHEFLTGRPMHSRAPLQRQNSNNDESQDTVPQVPETTTPTIPSDPINRLAEVLVGMNNRPSAQTLMVRPISTTTLTFDGKSEKFELFEDLFHTKIKMQPDMTETMKIKHFHSLLQKMPYKRSVTSIRQTGKHWKTF